MTGISELAFRTQLVIPEQKTLFDYWHARTKGGRLPGRNDISPAGFARLLPMISLIDVERSPKRYRIRLAGTGLHDIYQNEITGKYLDEFDRDCKGEYWLSACCRVVDRKKPAQGIIRSTIKSQDHLVQFWLRLPLSCDGNEVNMILCHDSFISMQKAKHLTKQSLAS